MLGREGRWPAVVVGRGRARHGVQPRSLLTVVVISVAEHFRIAACAARRNSIQDGGQSVLSEAGSSLAV